MRKMLGAALMLLQHRKADDKQAELVGTQWVVTDGSDTAWLDAQTGELVEIEFAAARP